MADYGRIPERERTVVVDTRNPAFDGYGLRDLSGHRKKVYAVAWNCDGRRLASGGEDRMIRVWTLEPHCGVAKPERPDAEYASHTDSVGCVEWHPSQPDLLASCSSGKADTNIRFHDARANKQIATVTCERNASLSWSPDGNQLVVASSSDELVFIDTRRMRKQRQWGLSGHTHLSAVRWGPTQSHITMALDDGTVRVCHLSRLDSPIWRLTSHASHTTCLAYSRDYKLLASGGSDALVSLWELEEMTCVRTHSRPDQSIRTLGFSADGQWLAYCSGDNSGTIDVVSTRTGELASVLSLKGYCGTLAWNPVAPVLAFPSEESAKEYAPITIWAPPKPTGG